MTWRRVLFRMAAALLLVPAVGLTFARVVEPHTMLWLMAEAFTPLGIPLYAAALVLLGLRLVWVRGRWNWVGAGAAAVGLVLHCWWWAPQVTGDNPPPAAGAERLVVMTVNIAQYDGDGYRLGRIAAAQHVDLLVVEEINARGLADLERSGITDQLSYEVGNPDIHGIGTMVFSRTPFGPALRTHTTHNGWIVPWHGLTIIAAHPQAPTRPDLWSADQATLLAAVQDFRPDLVLGDLNATNDHEPLRALADAGYRDVGELANVGWQPTWPASDRWHLLPGISDPLAQIDHVLVGPRMAAIGQHTVDVPGSDHRAVVAEVALR